MVNPRIRRLLLAFLASAAIDVGAGEQALLPKFSVPPDDLARAHVGDFRVTFMANGAFVLDRQGEYLLDGGVGFSLAGWKRWGDQIRQSSPTDTRRLLKNGRGIAFSGTIFDVHRKPTLSCKETVVGLPGGLRFDYELQPMEDLSLIRLGPTFHWPVPRFVGQPSFLLPGFRAWNLGTAVRKLNFPLTSARYCLLETNGSPLVGLVPRSSAKWIVFDDRNFELNVARLFCNPVEFRPDLSKGKPIRMGFDLHLLPLAPLPELQIASDRLHVDYVGVGHLLVNGRRAAQMGLCWRMKPDEPWRYALAVPRRSRLAAAKGEAQGISFDGPVGAAFKLGFAGTRQDSDFRVDWNVAKIKTPLPAEMGIWLIFRKQAKPAAAQEGRPGRLEVATDARTTVVVEADGEWSHRVQKLWGSDCLLAVARFATQDQPSFQKRVTLRGAHSENPAPAGEARNPNE